MTVRTKAQLNTLYADNTTAEISPEDLRDFVDTAIRDTPTAAGASNFGDAASGGTSEELAKVDHKHSREANPITAHEAAADPHTGYVREADANWVDLTDGGGTTLHTHAASVITNTPAGTVAAVTVQAAIDELATDYAAADAAIVAAQVNLGKVIAISSGAYLR